MAGLVFFAGRDFAAVTFFLLTVFFAVCLTGLLLDGDLALAVFREADFCGIALFAFGRLAALAVRFLTADFDDEAREPREAERLRPFETALMVQIERAKWRRTERRCGWRLT